MNSGRPAVKFTNESRLFEATSYRGDSKPGTAKEAKSAKILPDQAVRGRSQWALWF
jgi:hypothetical protein